MLSGNEFLILIIVLAPIALIVGATVLLVTRSGARASTNVAGGPTPAGWFADPAGRHQSRYWDGSDWTDHVVDNGTPGTDPV